MFLAFFFFESGANEVVAIDLMELTQKETATTTTTTRGDYL